MSMYDPEKHHRRSIRLKGYDYTQPGAYFITLVTKGRECLFGEIESGVMQLNRFGHLAENEWIRLGVRFKRVVVDEFMVMPNHVHGILVIREDDPNGTEETIPGNAPIAKSESLGTIVGAYKSNTARLINSLRWTPGEPVWQRNFYEHIIRNDDEWRAIRDYIKNNPLQWEQDREDPMRHR